jgi:16S rRNA A1518/A1519 N6-dimethyltransferase RsmA/KsgA/DIM1 with predicted DNA glycosylase/AP lyase activity
LSHSPFNKGFHYKKSLSQNFLVNERQLKKIASAPETKTKVALEVGAGSGNLSCHLAQVYQTLFLIEKDTRCIPILKDRIPKATVWESDFLTFSRSSHFTQIKKHAPLTFFSNMPYQHTSAFLHILSDCSYLFEEAILVMQTEVAEKIAGPYCPNLTAALIKAKADVQIIGYIPKEHFYPKPGVESAIVRCLFKPFDEDHWEEYVKFLKALYLHKNKQLKKTLKSLSSSDKTEKILLLSSLSGTERSYQIAPEVQLRLFSLLKDF